MMVGREVFLGTKPKAGKIGEVVIELKDIYVPGDRELSKKLEG